MKSFSPFEDLNFKRCYLKVIAHIFLFNSCINWFSSSIKLIYIKMMLFHWFHTSPCEAWRPRNFILMPGDRNSSEQGGGGNRETNIPEKDLRLMEMVSKDLQETMWSLPRILCFSLYSDPGTQRPRATGDISTSAVLCPVAFEYLAVILLLVPQRQLNLDRLFWLLRGSPKRPASNLSPLFYLKCLD